MDHAETVAKQVLEGVLPGTMEYQPEQSHGEYDFELRYHSGATAAVEATESVDRTQVQSFAAIRNKKKAPFIQSTKCRKSWVIFPAKNAKIEKIRAEADEYLLNWNKRESRASLGCVILIISAFKISAAIS